MKVLKKRIIANISIAALLGGLIALGSPAPASASEPFIGQIQMVGFGFPPRGWANCDGQLLPITQNTALFSLLGTTFGGDGRTTFGLPDLRGRTAVHPGTGPGLSTIRWGQKGGNEATTLLADHMPNHTHTATLHASSGSGTAATPASGVLAGTRRDRDYSTVTPNVTMAANAITVSPVGGGQSFSIRDPFLGIYHVIALRGIFPSRN